MIIQIRGTSGSGKTTVMRAVMEALGPWKPVFREGRKQPLYYVAKTKTQRLAVLGHYEATCGGCDNIGSAKSVYELIQEVEADVILSEGLLLSEDVKWSSQLDNLKIVFLTTDVDTCVQQIKSRRQKAGNEKPLNESNTRKRVSVIERARVKLIERGITCRRAPSNQAIEIIFDWIKSNG